MVERNYGPQGTIIVDDRYAPLIVISFDGEIQMSQGIWLEGVAQRLALNEAKKWRRAALIYDASRSMRANAEMRKFWAEMSTRTKGVMEATTLCSLVVVSSSIIRGVLTAVGWLNPDVAKLETFPTLKSAIDEASRRLLAARTPVTFPASGYELPEGDASVAAKR